MNIEILPLFPHTDSDSRTGGREPEVGGEGPRVDRQPPAVSTVTRTEGGHPTGRPGPDQERTGHCPDRVRWLQGKAIGTFSFTIFRK